MEELGLLRWRFHAGGPVRAAPVLREGILYVGSTAGRLHALDAGSGEPRWSYAAGAPLISAVTATGDRIFLQDREGTVHALRRDDGTPVWTRETGPEVPLPWGWEGWDYVGPAPVLAASDPRPDTTPSDPAGSLGGEGTRGRGAATSRLLVASGDGELRALAPETGDELWSFDTGARLRATPTVDDGTVYLGDGAGVFRAIDLADGRELWRFETDGHAMDPAAFGFDRRQIYSSAAVDAGRVYFGSRDANVYALHGDTGELLWKANDGTSAWVMGTPVVRDGRVWVTRSSSTRVRALDAATGDEIWSVQTDGFVFATPRLVGGTVYVGNEAGTLLALDARTGERRWRYGLGSGIWSAPLVADVEVPGAPGGRAGRLWVGSADGQVRAFDARRGPTPLLAVFFDEELASRSVLGSAPHHRAILHHFERRGYERLDSAAAGAFLSARIDDGIPSAVVFAMDALPTGLTRDGAGGDPLLRRYLVAGGRVAWLGTPPALFVFDEEGRRTALDRDGPAALLGVDHGAYTGDRHPAWPTAAGRRMGLESWWLASPTAPAAADVTVLAIDELGRPAAWLRRYVAGAGPTGGSFVHLYAPLDTGRLDEVRAVVEHGLFRSAATREVEHR